MRKGRGIDHHWEIRKYLGDIAWYAYCSCGFEYACSRSKRTETGFSFEQEIDLLYNYCPNCGAREKQYNTMPIKINKCPWE
jgi:hypothetical protein